MEKIKNIDITPPEKKYLQNLSHLRKNIHKSHCTISLNILLSLEKHIDHNIEKSNCKTSLTYSALPKKLCRTATL